MKHCDSSSFLVLDPAVLIYDDIYKQYCRGGIRAQCPAPEDHAHSQRHKIHEKVENAHGESNEAVVGEVQGLEVDEFIENPRGQGLQVEVAQVPVHPREEGRRGRERGIQTRKRSV